MGRRGVGGFTVLELLIVISVFQAIAATVVLSTKVLQRRAAVVSCKRAVQEIETSAEVVRARTASYPAPVDGRDKAANPLLVGTGTLSRWPKGTGYALIWDGRDVEV